MRQRLIDFLLLLLAAAAGFYIPGFLFYLFTYFGWLPSLPANSGEARIFLAKFQLAPLFWLGGTLLGLSGLALPRRNAARRELRGWLFAMPVLLPLLYTALVFVYFNFLPPQFPAQRMTR